MITSILIGASGQTELCRFTYMGSKCHWLWVWQTCTTYLAIRCFFDFGFCLSISGSSVHTTNHH